MALLHFDYSSLGEDPVDPLLSSVEHATSKQALDILVQPRQLLPCNVPHAFGQVRLTRSTHAPLSC